jgi:hypothetical protein
MSDEKGGFGSGILKGLKNLLFTDGGSTDAAPAPSNTVPVSAPTAPPPPAVKPIVPPPAASAPVGDAKEMRLKVYQLLESMNQPGCDFFEVWNAATEMGGTNATNIKAAYTSLRFADATLSKEKLVQTGQHYKTSLLNVLDTETRKRQEEKNDLLRQEEQAKSNLQQSIAQLEQQIAGLQQQLAAQKAEADNIHDKYQPAINEIDAKMAAGQQSVSSVVAEMDQVLAIIQQALN